MEAPPPIALGIAITSSFIAEKTFVEHIPYHYVEQLLNNECLKDKWDLTNYSQKIASQSYLNEKEQLKAYLQCYNKKLGGFSVKYHKAKHKWGRVFASKALGLTCFAKKTRNTLIKDLFYDFDLSNAQPQILRNICKANAINHDIIEKYCNEREQIMSDIITASEGLVDREQVKSLIIRLSFYGGFMNWMKEQGVDFPEPVIVRNYRSQVQEIASKLSISNPELYKTMERCKKDKGESNFMGSFLSTYLQEYELRLVEFVLKKICSETYICSTDVANVFAVVYEYDGLKILKERVDAFGGPDALLAFMNQANLEFGFDIKWELKPITKFYDIQFIAPAVVDKEVEKNKKLEEKNRLKSIQKLEKKLEKEKENDIFIKEREEIKEKFSDKLAHNDITCANIIYKQIKDNIKYSNKKLYYKTNYMWVSDEFTINCLLSIYISNSEIKKLNDNNEFVDYVENRKNSQNVLKLVIDLAVNNVDNDWSNNMFKSSLGYILFKNGYHDFKESRFIPFDSSLYDHSIIFMEQIPYNYIGCEDKEYLKSVKQRMFIDPFGEDVADYYILNIARGLAGDAMKRVLFGVGDGNTGKSSITSAIKSSIGGYFGTFNANNLTVKKFANPDDAQSLRWVMLLASKRIIISNEIENGVAINGNVIKKISSGGKDDIVARGHGGYETEYQISFLPIIFANDLDSITPMDDAIVNRVRAIPYVKTYVDNPKENSILELKIDPNFDQEILTDNFRNAFMLLLMKAYKKFVKNNKVEVEPPQIKRAIVNTFGKIDSFIDSFKNDFEITNNENDFVLSSLLVDWIKINKHNISITKLGREINKYVIEKELKNVESKAKKIGGKTKQVWSGIKFINDDIELKIMVKAVKA